MRRWKPSALLLLVSLIATTSCSFNRTSGSQGGQTAPAAAAEQTPCSLPNPDKFVSDHSNVLDENSERQLEAKLTRLRSSGKIDFAVVIVDTTGTTTVGDYSLALANCWGIGGKNPDKAGLLLLVAIKDRKWHIQITRVLESILTNAEVYEIGNLMTPDFKQGKYSSGVNKGVDAMIDVLAKRRNFSV